MQLAHVTFAADPANIDGKFEGPPLVSLDSDILGSLLSSGIHTRRQDLWDDIWTALNIAGVDVAQPPGIRTDAHDFVRDGIHMPRCPLPSATFYLMLVLAHCNTKQEWRDHSFKPTLQAVGIQALSDGHILDDRRAHIKRLLCLHRFRCHCSHACTGKMLQTCVKEASSLGIHLCFLLDHFSMMFLACTMWPFSFNA